MRWLLFPVFWLTTLAAFGQESFEGSNFPLFPVPGEVLLKSSVKLPAKINLAKSKYFPDIFEQYGWSCNQSSSIGYLFTYELNRLRNADGGLPENRYSPFYVWNFLNGTKSGTGVSYFDSWEIIKAGGAPNEVDYSNNPDLKFWMSGYDRYYRAMQNRVLKNWSMPVGTAGDLQLLKRYLFDHFDGSKFGGMANFQIASGGMNLGKLPKNSYDEGAAYVSTFGTYVGHALTIVGYNDSIRLDRNDDGQYTNNIDINGDHMVDLKDFEKGALIVANTWGKGWGDNGFAYVPYHLLGLYGCEGGLWNKSIHIIEAAKTVDPILTLRAAISHSCKGSIRIMAGVSNNPDATEPEHILEFPMFNYQGAQVPFYRTQRPDTTLFELGLDLSPLVDFIDTDKPVRIFLIVDEKDSWNNYDGIVRSFVVYNQFNTRDSTICIQSMVPVVNNSRTLLSVVRQVRFNRIRIKEVPLLFAKAGEFVSVQMDVTGAVSPYSWELVPDYQIGFSKATLPDWGGKQLYNGQFGNPVNRIDLPFKFRFFGNEYDHFSVTEDGDLLFDQEEYAYPYAIDPKLVFRTKKKVTGFGYDLDYYMPGNMITWFGNDTIVAITWKAIVPSTGGGEPVTMVCELHPDGRIRYYYDKPLVLFPPGTPTNIGVSNGDSQLFRNILAFNPDQTTGVNCLSISPYLYPMETRFDETGWLFCKPDHPNTLYEVKVRVVDKNNRSSYSSVRISTQDMTSARLLSESFPNPFTNETHFHVVVPEKSQVVIEIFDLRGSRIAGLLDKELIPAEYEYSWDGRQSGGSIAGCGVYLCRLRVGTHVECRKLIKSK